ncbi:MULTISPECIES: hypothetical protein [Bacteroides]|nr:hypothetical protein [Bacteroides sp.]
MKTPIKKKGKVLALAEKKKSIISKLVINCNECHGTDEELNSKK